jgi:hypothetical protein
MKVLCIEDCNTNFNKFPVHFLGKTTLWEVIRRRVDLTQRESRNEGGSVVHSRLNPHLYRVTSRVFYIQ